MSDDIALWGERVPLSWLTPQELAYIGTLPRELPAVEWIWQEMDRVWRNLGLDNSRPLSQQPVADFYGHPIWLVNGLFTRADPVSARHRASIANYIQGLGANHVADYGGGFGELALAVVQAVPGAQISIIEPFLSHAGRERMRQVPQVKFVEHPAADIYDVTVAQDVLEHVEDPVALAYALASSVRPGGWVIFANCFYPVIDCHLPSTFHLRHTFAWVMHRMGLRRVGSVPGVPHAQVFQRVGAVDLGAARRGEGISRMVGPVLNRLADVRVAVTHLVRTK